MGEINVGSDIGSGDMETHSVSTQKIHRKFLKWEEDVDLFSCVVLLY